MSVRIYLLFFLSFFVLPAEAQKASPVRIGLLIQDNNSPAAKQGAELAVKLANEKEGIGNQMFQVMTKDMGGAWGNGSKQAVDLIFENKVCALLGSHDGRNGHLVEQAATKSTVVFVSAWSSDPTLSKAFVPWFFNCVPNDRQQADELIKEIYDNRKFTNVVTISDNAYDSKQAIKSFLLNLKLSGKNESVNLFYANYTAKIEILADQIIKAKANCVVLYCEPSVSLRIVRLMQQRKLNMPVFGFLSILNENVLSEKELQEFDGVLSIPSGIHTESKDPASVFRKEYQKLYGKMPGLVAAYAFDGMNLLIEAVSNSKSTEREKIQNYLENVTYVGVTGTFGFDQKGNRTGKLFMAEIKNGYPVSF